MTRRDLLNRFALTAAGLYVPTRTFFLPPSKGWPLEPLEIDLLLDDRKFQSELKRVLTRMATEAILGCVNEHFVPLGIRPLTMQDLTGSRRI